MLLLFRLRYFRCARHLVRVSNLIAPYRNPAIGFTSLALMTKKHSQAHKNTAVCGLRVTEQEQLQPPQTDHFNTRPRVATYLNRHNTAAAVVVVTLCFVSMAAAQPGQCPATWTTAVLSVARSYLAAASLPNQGLAVFAGGESGGTYFHLL